MTHRVQWHTILFVLILVALTVGACGPAATPAPQNPDGAGSAATPAAEEPQSQPAEAGTEGEAGDKRITIGIMAPFTGPLAAAAQDSMDGWELYWKNRGSTEVAGVQIEWHTADDQNDAATGITQAKALVEQRGVDFIVGPFSTHVGVGVADELSRRNVPVFVPILSADSITQRHRLSNVVRIAGWGASQVTHPFGQWAYGQGYRRISTICFELEFGYEHCGGFVNTFTDAGGEIVTQVWNPLTTEDYSPFIAQLQQSNPEAVFVGVSGIGAVRFVEQWDEFGLKDQIPLLVTETVVDQSALRSMDDSALGIISAGHFAEGRDAAATQKFVETYLAEYGNLPSYFSAAMYTAADWLVTAIEQVDGDLSDMDAFIDAVRKVEVADSALGPMTLDEYDHPVQEIYIRQVEKRDDGRLWNVVIETFPEVSQFWTYDPEEFLSQPAYSREYQGQ